MKYIIYSKENNKIIKILSKNPRAISKNYGIARCENIPQYNSKNGEYLEVVNVKPFFGEDILVDESISDIVPLYYTCELTVKVNDKIAKRNRINKLKQKLREYDYIGVKIATGRATKEEYATQIAEMDAWATEINELEGK